MQAAGTLRGTRVISLLVLLVSLIGYAYSAPLQYLPNIPGYVPVYIRYGDEPLEDINPELAEAFGESPSSAKVLLLRPDKLAPDKPGEHLDRTLAHVSNNFKDNDIDALLEESADTHPYPLRIRAAQSRSFATSDELGDRNKPKLLTIYQLPDDNDNRRNRRRNRGRTRALNRTPSRVPAFKVSPLSDAEIEKLEKLPIEREEMKPNEFNEPSLKSSESPRAMTRNRQRTRHFGAPVKVQEPLEESSMNLLEIANLSKPPSNRNIAAPKADKNKSGTASRPGKHEPPIKEQRPATILSNVDKISPIDLPDKDATEENKTRSSTVANDEVAME